MNTNSASKDAKNSTVEPLSKNEYMNAVQKIALRGTNSTNKLTVQDIRSNIGLRKQIDLLEKTSDELELYRQQFTVLDDILKHKINCRTCCSQLSTEPEQKNQICTHPLLLVTQCSTCNDFYMSGEFERGEDGSELYCRWCGQGGEVYCCAECIFVFCKACIKRNFPKECMRDVLKNENWKCFACVPEYTIGLRARHWALLKYIERNSNEINKEQSSSLNCLDTTTLCSRRLRTVSEKTATFTPIKLEKVDKPVPLVRIEDDNLHAEPVNAENSYISLSPVPYVAPPVVSQPTTVLPEPMLTQQMPPGLPFPNMHQPSIINQRYGAPIWYPPPTQQYGINTRPPSYRMAFYPQSVMRPSRLSQPTQHMNLNETAHLNESSRHNTQVRLPNGHILDLNRLIARNNDPRGVLLQNNTMLQNMLLTRHPPPPLISGNPPREISPPVQIPPPPPETILDVPTTMARTRLDLHLNNAMEVCQHITQKMRKFPTSQAYQQSRSTTDIIQLNLHLAYLLDYTVERFQSLQKKCVEDTQQLNKSLMTSKDEVEIIEPESHVIDVDDDDNTPLLKRIPLTIKRQIDSPLTISTPPNKRVRTPLDVGQGSAEDIYANNFLHLNHTSM